MPGTKIVVGIMEDTMPEDALSCSYFDEVFLLKSVLRYPNLSKFWFQYQEQEAKNACKAPLLTYIYDKYVDEQLFVYLESNSMVYSSLTELKTITKDHPIVITGYQTNSDFMDWEWRNDSGKSGVYCSGLLALKRHPEAKRFLVWWAKISERYAANEHAYFDLVPIYFDDVYTLRHPGYGIDHRNIIERWNIEQTPHSWTINGNPLRTIHFSPEIAVAAAWIDESKGQLYSRLYQNYKKELDEATASKPSASWSYGIYISGEQISHAAKAAFRENYYDNPEFENPFALSNAFFQTESAENWNADNVVLPYDDEVKRVRRPKRVKAFKAARRRSKPRNARKLKQHRHLRYAHRRSAITFNKRKI